MAHLTPVLILASLGNIWMLFLGLSVALNTAQQMGSCCSWVVFKLLVFTEGTRSSREVVQLSEEVLRPPSVGVQGLSVSG